MVFRLEGGNEDTDLWVERSVDDAGNPILCSVWELTAEERDRVAAGANIELVTWGEITPPVSLAVTAIKLGRRRDVD
jgi:hypothetical protein